MTEISPASTARQSVYILEREKITGVSLGGAPTAENVAVCSELSAKALQYLVERRHVLYNQILYPYADALSLSGAPGTESTRIFGTRILLRGVPDEAVSGALAECGAPSFGLQSFELTDGAVKSGDVAAFLGCQGACDGICAGDFSALLSGWLPHWRIRESARVFASFCELSYRRAKGGVVGLCGGRLMLAPGCESPEALAEIFTQKTGAECAR